MQFTHLFFENHVINSDYFKALIPLLKKLKVRALQRMKVNNTIKTNEIRLYRYHVDFDTSKNEAVGKTIFTYNERSYCF